MAEQKERVGVPDGGGDGFPLAGQVRLVMERDGVTGWELRTEEFWTRLLPPDHRPRPQGWKLHVSATPLSAPLVLVRAAGELFRFGCAFKFAGTLERAEALVSGRYDRAGAGKFLTAYPDSDEHALKVAEALDRATAGLPGQEILSDRPYRAGSLVHYRYGAFRGRRVLTNDGSYEIRLTAPDGSAVRDERRPAFTPPAWADIPFPQPSRPAGPPRRALLLADRFLVRGAIRHANKGGVFRATDRTTGAEVVVKQARRHTAARLNGEDARDALRREAAVLDQLGPLGLAPRKVALFDHRQDLFLAQSVVPGVPLRRWTAERFTGEAGLTGLPLGQLAALGRAVTDLVAAVHAQGLVLRDLTPNNLMITPQGEVGLVDLELAVRPGTHVNRAGTPGYAAPEQMAAERWAPAPAPTADLFSLGAVLFHLATGADPVFAPDDAPGRSSQARTAALLAAAAVRSPAVRRTQDLILALLREDPSLRPGLDEVRTALAGVGRAEAAPGPVADAPGEGAGLAAGRRERLLADGLDHLLATMRPDAQRLWPTGAFGATTDPCAVQHGAAGPIALLTRLAARDTRAREGLATAAEWLDRALTAEPTVLPGLYFGRSGTAWALHDAARVLGDDAMAARATALAARVPLHWPNPDVCHGAAGAGLAQLHLWRATGDGEFLSRAERCADGLAGAADRTGGARWPIPAGFDSALAGVTHHGFAHGTAGVGTFLLTTATVTGREDLHHLAVQAGDTLLAAADRDGDAAWWGTGESTGPATRLPNWCSGSSGIGTFLVRLWAATGETRFREAAEAAAAAVLRYRWQTSAAACHGLAGNGQFLLDLAHLLGEPRYLEQAEELAACIDARHTVRDGRQLIPDETHTEVFADYQTGSAGALDFLHRLQYGGPRPWLPDLPYGDTLTTAAGTRQEAGR
ncbi:class IV lanthionine synthetase LanL [Streptomyces sp. NPDC051041]|uniref:class IV lanthionine synthetase LanL n=1 Tax=Streptomyces sp. NPDC051041 TaxID=3365640 RepID=UPI00378DA918